MLIYNYISLYKKVNYVIPKNNWSISDFKNTDFKNFSPLKIKQGNF